MNWIKEILILIVIFTLSFFGGIICKKIYKASKVIESIDHSLKTLINEKQNENKGEQRESI